MRSQWLILLSLLPLAYGGQAEDTLLWGAYRPNLYFGLRPRLPESLMTGLMWFGTQDYQSIGKSRHSCEQNELDSYTWTEYDPREGGVQVLKDGLNNVKVTTEFLKIPGGNHGGSWAARIRGEPLRPDEPSRNAFFFYFGLDGMGELEMVTPSDEDGIEGEVAYRGNTPDLGEFKIRIRDGPDNNYITFGPHYEDFKNRVDKTHYYGRPAAFGTIWKAKDYIIAAIAERFRAIANPYAGNLPDAGYMLTLPNDVADNSNFHAVQKIFDGSFQFDVYFESASANRKLTSSTLDQGIPALVEAYNQRFRAKLPHPSDYPVEQRDKLESFSKAVTSNLFGGVGYFYGTSMVDKKFSYEWDEEESTDGDVPTESGAKLTEPKALLTATPSRSFFPRGFYWDEGFHLLHIGQIDNDFSLEILKHWVDLIDDNGWVAREQILGEEARSKVPAEFQTQVPNYANPPTLAMAVTAFIDRFKSAASKDSLSAQDLGMDTGMGGAQVPLGIPDEVVPDSGSKHVHDKELAFDYLKSIYAPLKRHYEWFRKSQRGLIKQYSRKARSRTEGYRWRGRTEQHVLTSGMDDYPRGRPDAGELHLDLLAWVGFFSRTMKDIAAFIGETEDEAVFAKNEQAILGNIEDLHWNEEEKMYCDLGVNEDDESIYICHRGYLSLFPFLLSLLPPDSPHLGSILELLRDPEHLWSMYGLRSLSASHPEFGQGENYWKGPIWIQMNYLALSALHKTYAKQPGPYQQRAQEIYKELRKNVVDNVVKEYERTGYVWEQYDALTGEGRRSHPFTGWTSLTALILAEKY
ncbi:glucosidase I [Coprinopsis marcescibilis]|uniref:Mannosyl-oligosaccharide glucosidase n=1 Tax=Coprinopsis marcescibilis TaxID=230819 RepID=A0A5C3L111_COPMA|nr:glucosidase I [Coprinopsis marcescibilis]